MKPTSKVEFYRDENQNMNSSSKSSGGYGDDSLNSFFHKRHLDATRKSFPEVRSKDGRLIDPNQDDFLMLVCREMDRNLLRTIKDTPLPPHYINYKDANGWTPLSFLCIKGDFILVKMLCEFKDVDVNVQDNEGNTPLMLASQGGHSSVVTFLLDKFKSEIDVNKRNAFGFTAVMKAALQGRIKCVRSLLASGANVMLKDPGKGYTAAEWAEFCGRKSCAEAIKLHQKQEKSKSSKRLSQAFCDTENWFKSKLGSSSGGNTSPGSPGGGSSASSSSSPSSPPLKPGDGGATSLLAKATATSTLCASLPILQNASNPMIEEKRPFVIPSIHVTPD